jgi:hypothetical protein
MNQDYPDPVEMDVMGFAVMVDEQLGHLMVTHDGSLTWDQLQEIKGVVWGNDARAIEVYPATADVVNSGQFRHLWKLGADDFFPDLLGRSEPKETLERRFNKAWDAANG